MMKYLFFSFILISTTFTIEAKVEKNERALVVISELDTNGLPEFEPLYTLLEYLTKVTVENMLRDSYQEIHFLNNEEATAAKFKQTLKRLTSRDDLKALDVILSLHGNPDRLYFKDRSWGMSELEAEMLRSKSAADETQITVMKKKLRIMYNLSCYGSSHNKAFYNMGFDVSTGSIKVNANAEAEFIPFVSSWKKGKSFKRSFLASNNFISLYLADEPIRELGRRQNTMIKNTESKKLFYGFIKTNIFTDPR